MSRHHFELPVTADNLWFLERYLSVFEFFDMFPQDAISADDERGIPIRLHTDRDFVIETDIDRSKMQFRNRSKLNGWTRFTSEHKLQAGDRIIFDKTSDRDYNLHLLRP